MKRFRKIWDEELNGWIRDHAHQKTRESYEDFLLAFPLSGVTYAAFSNQRSRLHVSPASSRAGQPRHHCLVGSEHTKKGYIMVKVAEPNVWRFRHHVEWEKAHPGEVVAPKTHTVIFLDLDNRNFSPENLYRTERTLMARINSGKFGKLVPGNPEGNLHIIMMARLEQVMFERAEQVGMAGKSTGGRFFRESHNRKVSEYFRRRYHSDPRFREKIARNGRAYRAGLSDEQRSAVRNYKREWARKKRNKGELDEYEKE